MRADELVGVDEGLSPIVPVLDEERHLQLQTSLHLQGFKSKSTLARGGVEDEEATGLATMSLIPFGNAGAIAINRFEFEVIGLIVG